MDEFIINTRDAELVSQINMASKVDLPLIIRGETGVGKEALARYIHSKSKRFSNSFIILYCNAIPRNLLESELFGFEKGSFTGATESKSGIIEYAKRNTIY